MDKQVVEMVVGHGAIDYTARRRDPMNPPTSPLLDLGDNLDLVTEPLPNRYCGFRVQHLFGRRR